MTLVVSSVGQSLKTRRSSFSHMRPAVTSAIDPANRCSGQRIATSGSSVHASIFERIPIANGVALASGLAQFNAGYSNPSTLNAYSIRVDHF